MSIAAGEYVSVHSQVDTERADLAVDLSKLKADDKGEHKELMAIYVGRGLDPSLAKQVAEQLMAHDALGAHARDELGISETLRARPIQAALASAGSSLLERWSSRAPLGHYSGPGGGFDPHCLRNCTGVPRDSRRVGCTRRWSGRDDGGNSRHVLGRACHGADRRRRVAVS
jgi:VIT family